MPSNQSRNRPRILFAFNQSVRDDYIAPEDLTRLEALADWDWFPCEGGGIYNSNDDSRALASLRAQVGSYDGLIVCRGAPTISDEIMAAAPRLRIIGELEGDRFASRIDLDAAWARDIRTVDVTNGSSYPVAEWALGLILLSMRNASAHFRRIIAGQTKVDPVERARIPGNLKGKRVGLIGCGIWADH